jgi:hypothetical protein
VPNARPLCCSIRSTPSNVRQVTWHRTTQVTDSGDGAVQPLVELLVRWDSLRERSRPSPTLFLVDVARSLLEGDPVAQVPEL